MSFTFHTDDGEDLVHSQIVSPGHDLLKLSDGDRFTGDPATSCLDDYAPADFLQEATENFIRINSFEPWKRAELRADPEFVQLAAKCGWRLDDDDMMAEVRPPMPPADTPPSQAPDTGVTPTPRPQPRSDLVYGTVTSFQAVPAGSEIEVSYTFATDDGQDLEVSHTVSPGDDFVRALEASPASSRPRIRPVRGSLRLAVRRRHAGRGAAFAAGRDPLSRTSGRVSCPSLDAGPGVPRERPDRRCVRDAGPAAVLEAAAYKARKAAEHARIGFSAGG